MTHSLTVIYNADCPICAREIDAYRRYSDRRGLGLLFQPLQTADLARWGLTPTDAAKRLHAIRDGRMLDGGDAFRAVWAEMPALAWLSRLLALPGLRQITDLVYDHVLAPALYQLHRRRVRRQRAG